MTCIERDPKNFDLVYDNYVALLVDADRYRAALEGIARNGGRPPGFGRWDGHDCACVASRALTPPPIEGE